MNDAISIEESRPERTSRDAPFKRKSSSFHSFESELGLLIFVGLAYFTLAYLGLRLASIHPSATPIWPPTGLAIAAILLRGHRVAAAIFIGAFLINQLTFGSIFTSLAIATGNTLEAVIASYLVKLWGRGEPIFETPMSVIKFALISLAATMISATIGASSLTITGYAEVSSFISIWLTWWFGDFAGAVVVAPVVVLWAETDPGSLTLPQIKTTALSYVAAVAIGLIVFTPLLPHTTFHDALIFLVVLPLLWAALRRGPRDTATVALIISGFVVWCTVMQCGAFAKPNLNDSFMLSLGFVISTAILSLVASTGVMVARHIEDKRLKLAHDLHDGILQSLTAAALRLKACSKDCEGEIRDELDSIQQLLAVEQRRIRDAVGGQKNENEDFGLAKACEDVLAELSSYWHCKTPLRVVPSDARISSVIAKNLWLILAEGIANAAKHGGATRVLVDLEQTSDALVISLSDNGNGFRGLSGAYTDETLIAQHVGPRFLCERVRALRGSFMLSTSPAGARLQIRLPVE
jgi:signal transduction histidine kinase